MISTNRKISVIIPIYNVERYLRKCIDSVISQTYQNIELILVNDGSTDGSTKICDVYAAKDKRITVIHKENGGLSSARNAGLEIANGYYIAFLDSDDWIDTEMYQVLIQLLEQHDADISACGLKEIYDDKTLIASNTAQITKLDRTEAINSLITGHNSVRFEVWNKVFKSEIIRGIRFKEGQIYEDVYFDRKVFLKLNKLVYIDLPMHNYLKVRDGNTNSNFKEKKLAIFCELDDFAKELEERGMHDSALRFQAFSLFTSITLYLNAIQLRTSESILRRIRSRHWIYHKQNKKNPYVNKMKSNFFLYLPNFFCLISNVKSRFEQLYNR